MLDDRSSLRIKLLRFPLIVGIVFNHAYATTVQLASGNIGSMQNNAGSDFIRNIISHGISLTSTPLFFLISGYLFFNVEFDSDHYKVKLQNRIKTLLIPFLFWNVFTMLLIAFGQQLYVTHQYFSGQNELISNYKFADYVNAIFGIGRMPISIQFWFIRDLMILVLFSPIIYLANKYIPLIFISVLFICWYMDIMPNIIPSARSMLFFSIGALITIRKGNLFAFDKYGTLFSLVYTPIVILDALSKNENFNPYLHRLGILCGMVVMLAMTNYILNSFRLKKIILSISGATFMVYAAHEPLLTITRKIIYKLFVPQSQFIIIAFYFIIPLIVTSFLVITFKIMNKYIPNTVKIITGGR